MRESWGGAVTRARRVRPPILRQHRPPVNAPVEGRHYEITGRSATGAVIDLTPPGPTFDPRGGVLMV